MLSRSIQRQYTCSHADRKWCFTLRKRNGNPHVFDASHTKRNEENASDLTASVWALGGSVPEYGSTRSRRQSKTYWPQTPTGLSSWAQPREVRITTKYIPHPNLELFHAKTLSAFTARKQDVTRFAELFLIAEAICRHFLQWQVLPFSIGQEPSLPGPLQPQSLHVLAAGAGCAGEAISKGRAPSAPTIRIKATKYVFMIAEIRFSSVGRLPPREPEHHPPRS